MVDNTPYLVEAAPGPWFQTDFPPAEFAARRMRVAESIGPGSVAVLAGLGETGAFDLFRQGNDFYYLCGVETPHVYLLIEGGSARATLYLPSRDAKHERSEGAQLNSDDSETARRLTGVDAVRALEALRGDVSSSVERIYTPSTPAEGRQACQDTLRFARRRADIDPWDRRIARETQFRELVCKACPAAELCDLSPILDGLRVVKSPREVALMHRAGRLTAAAVVEAMRCTRPGVMEYQLAAAADYVFAVNGARGAGYRPIVAGGKNIWNAHYYRNNCPLADGDLVLMDYAPDVGCYTSDIGRMWPVNGRYAPWQRELYGFVVQYHKALLRSIRPGVTADQVMDDVAAEMAAVVHAARWSDPAYESAAREMLAFRGHLSHPVGMAVHDVGDYFAGPLVPGHVFAVDPQMWVHDKQLYVRVEDTVAVTETGVEVLTRDAPLALDEVDTLVAEAGLLDAKPPLPG